MLFFSSIKSSIYFFVIETNNIYNNNELILLSASIINKKLDNILASLVSDKNIITPVTDTMPNCFEILLPESWKIV